MARIRSIKPEFWSSPDVEGMSPWARLLYIAMWNWADDDGRGTCNLRELQAFAFPHDEASEDVGTSDGFRRTLAEVRERFGVIFYKVGGRPYYAIPSWKQHQRTERTAQGRHPAPEAGEPWDFMPSTSRGTEAPTSSGASPRNVLRLPLEAPTTSGPGTGEQGNRGTGEATPNGVGASAPSEINAGTVVGAWVEAMNAKNVKPSNGMRGQVGRLARELLDGGNDPGLVLEAAKAAGSKGFATLDREFSTLAARGNANQRPASVDDEEFQLPTPPREIADDPDRYVLWAREQKAAWQAARSAS